jgi:hypothetical protein
MRRMQAVLCISCSIKLPLYQFGHLVTGPGSGTAGIGAFIITHACTFIRGVISYPGSGLPDITTKRGIVLHKMCGRQADLSTVQQQIDMLLCAMFATRLPARVSRLLTDSMTVQAILNTLLHLNLTHWFSGIALHS